MRTLEYTIEKEFENRKLYSFLKGNLKLSSKLIRTLKRTPDGMLCNGEHIRTVDLLKEGDVVTLNLPDDEKFATACDLMPQVIYEDSDLLIVNKPAMLPIHESHNHQCDTLANSVSGYLQKKNMRCTFRAIGRLDKGTSGLVVCALNSHAAARLSGEIEKEYLAIATGEYHETGTIDAPIYRPDPIKTYRTVDERGDRAVTHWESLATNGELTLLRVKIETGRTHQIRVHFASLNTPLLGDTMYGTPSEEINHQALHCAKLKLIHPITNEVITCEAEMPLEMQRIASRLTGQRED